MKAFEFELLRDIAEDGQKDMAGALSVKLVSVFRLLWRIVCESDEYVGD